MRVMFPVALLAGLLVVSSSAPPTHAQESPILSAMQDELRRSMAELKLKDEPAPYYIDYEIDDVSTLRVIARLGALLDDTLSHSRTLYIDVRVGDYAFDSSRFVIQGRGGGGGDGGSSVTLDENYDVMRRQIWLATDAAYKRAVSIFARKKAAFQIMHFIFPTCSQRLSRRRRRLWCLKRQTWVGSVQQLSTVFAGPPRLRPMSGRSRRARTATNSEGPRPLCRSRWRRPHGAQPTTARSPPMPVCGGAVRRPAACFALSPHARGRHHPPPSAPRLSARSSPPVLLKGGQRLPGRRNAGAARGAPPV